tara:strand:- start:425 stop:853 length:429 start_codon:yes stop_codon:yes gene_type:complete
MYKYREKKYKGRQVVFKAVNVSVESVFDHVITTTDSKGRKEYTCIENIGYFSKRYQKWIIREKNDKSDGATYAKDIDSFCWLFHDELCDTGSWEDGEPCTNWQGSSVLSDIMKEEGYIFLYVWWFLATWLFGGKKLRKNGMF